METLTKNDNGKMALVNIVEELVRQKVDELIRGMGMCCCERCRLNACAIALNNLPPHYVTTEKGALLGQLADYQEGYQANVTVEVTKALLTVKEKPLHGIVRSRADRQDEASREPAPR